MNNFAGELKRLRKERGLSQKELADKAELGDVQISTYENAKVVPTRKSLKALTTALELREDYFDEIMLDLVMGEYRVQSVSQDVLVGELLRFTNLRPSYNHSRMVLDMIRLLSKEYQ